MIYQLRGKLRGEKCPKKSGNTSFIDTSCCLQISSQIYDNFLERCVQTWYEARIHHWKKYLGGIMPPTRQYPHSFEYDAKSNTALRYEYFQVPFLGRAPATNAILWKFCHYSYMYFITIPRALPKETNASVEKPCTMAECQKWSAMARETDQLEPRTM